MQHEKSMEFLQIAMKYFPQAKEELDKAGFSLILKHFSRF